MSTTHITPEPTPVCVACGQQMTTTATAYRCPACGTTSGR